ncbi:MAG: DegT/DnrJ/EryC1/StrS family aminotransferase [Terriglobales bacterium]
MNARQSLAKSPRAPDQVAPNLLFPFLDLKAEYATMKDEIAAAVEKVLESQQFIMGPEVRQLEAEIAVFVGSSFALGCASGSDALLLALMALGVDSGDEVITPPFTFVATAGSISRLKARPVFVDIDRETYNLDPTRLEAAITSRTKAIMPVHLFGLAADMEKISEIARAHRLPVIEDAAQSIGARYHDQYVGNLGACGCFSFFPSKNLGGAGDGGMITTSDPELAERISMLRDHGSRQKYHYDLLGMNSRLDSLQAAILLVKFKHLEAMTQARRRNADRYRQLFRQAGLEKLIALPVQPQGLHHVYNQFVIRTPERDQLRDHLRHCGIPTEIYYPSPLHLQPAFADLGYRLGAFPESENASRQVLALPVFPQMTEEQQKMVADRTADFFAGRT